MHSKPSAPGRDVQPKAGEKTAISPVSIRSRYRRAAAASWSGTSGIEFHRFKQLRSFDNGDGRCPERPRLRRHGPFAFWANRARAHNNRPMSSTPMVPNSATFLTRLSVELIATSWGDSTG